MLPLDAKKTNPLDGGPSFSIRHKALRAVWQLTWLMLAAWTPPPLHGWRAWLLRRFHADVHPLARIYGSARVWYPPNLTVHANATIGPRVNLYCMDKMVIGEKAVVSQGAQLCCGTHDIASPEFQLVTQPIFVARRAWIAADAFVGPGVTVGEGAVIGARAVIFRDADPYGVYVGNPAIRLKARVFRSSEGP